VVLAYGKYVRFSKVNYNYSRKNKLLSRFKQGVGYAAAIIAFWLNCYYIVVLAWALYYVYHSITSSSLLPWSTCNNWWNLGSCRTLAQMRNYSASISCSTPLLTTNASVTACLRNASAHMAQFTSPVKEFWEYVVKKK
jgi:hypothetical protein